MKKVLNWFIKSSADPSKVSLTVRGALIGMIPTLILLFQQFGWNWSEQELSETIQAISSFIAGFLIVLGMIRKLVFSAKK